MASEADMRLDQAAKSLFLSEFVGAFILSMRYFSNQKRRSIIRMKKIRNRRAIAENMRCDAIQMEKSAVSPVSFVKPFVLRKPSPLKLDRVAMTERGARRVMTLIW